MIGTFWMLSSHQELITIDAIIITSRDSNQRESLRSLNTNVYFVIFWIYQRKSDAISTWFCLEMLTLKTDLFARMNNLSAQRQKYKWNFLSWWTAYEWSQRTFWKDKTKKKRFYFYWFSFPEKEKTSSFQWHFSPFLLSKWIQTVTGFKCVVSETKWNDFFFPRWNFRIQFAIKFMIRDFRLSDRHHFAQERRSLRKCTLFNRT